MYEGLTGFGSAPAISAYDLMPMPYRRATLSLTHSITCLYWSPATLCLMCEMTYRPDSCGSRGPVGLSARFSTDCTSNCIKSPACNYS